MRRTSLLLLALAGTGYYCHLHPETLHETLSVIGYKFGDSIDKAAAKSVAGRSVRTALSDHEKRNERQR